MPPVSRAALREALQCAGAPAVAAVLGAALRTEAVSVAVEGTTVLVRAQDGSETTYAVLADDVDGGDQRLAAPDVVVVTASGVDGPGDGTPVLGLDGLSRLVADASDRADVRRACRDHLGLAVDGWDPALEAAAGDGDGEGPDGESGEGSTGSGETMAAHAADGTGRLSRLPGRVPSVDLARSLHAPVPSVRTVVPVALGVAGLVVLASLLVGTGLAVGPLGMDPGDGATDTTAEQPTDELPSYALVGGGGEYPPGLGPTGLTNPTALARAHRDQVANASYELTYTYRERSGDGSEATREVTVWVAAEDTFRTDVSTDGEFRDSPPSFVDRPRYANGSHVFEQRGEQGERWYRTYPVRPAGGADDYADDARRYLGWFLTVEESSVEERFERDGTTYFRVDLRGDPWPGIDDVSGTAVVDEHGVVHAIRRQYSDDGDGRSVTVTMTYTAFGTATVDPPPWFDEAVAATRDGDTAGTPPATETAPDEAATDQQGTATTDSG